MNQEVKSKMNYEVINNYNYDCSFIDNLIKKISDKLSINDTFFTIILTDDNELRELNKNHRGIDKTTDVISFALNDNGKANNQVNLLGDIYISVPKMKVQALEYGHSETRELSFLVVHGLLHLLGYNHEDDLQEKIMFELQEDLLKLVDY